MCMATASHTSQTWYQATSVAEGAWQCTQLVVGMLDTCHITQSPSWNKANCQFSWFREKGKGEQTEETRVSDVTALDDIGCLYDLIRE